MSFSIIACIGKNRELGYNNDLIFHFKRDMQFFRQTTLNHPVIMGYNTFKSLPNGALPHRKNYVVTSHPELLPENVEAVTDLDDFIKNHAETEEIFVIGGAKIYQKFLPFADKIYLTEVDESAPADVFFPDFDPEKYDKIVLEQGEENGVKFTISKYIIK